MEKFNLLFFSFLYMRVAVVAGSENMENPPRNVAGQFV